MRHMSAVIAKLQENFVPDWLQWYWPVVDFPYDSVAVTLDGTHVPVHTKQNVWNTETVTLTHPWYRYTFHSP